MSVAYTVRIPKEDDEVLSSLAQKMERKKAHLIRKAITSYIQGLAEDQEDLNDALKILQDNKPNISWEEIQKDCGLLDD